MKSPIARGNALPFSFSSMNQTSTYASVASYQRQAKHPVREATYVLGLPYICAGNTNAYTGRLVCSGLWKSLCKCTVCANIEGKITLLLFLFSPSLTGKFMSVHGIQRPLLLSHQVVLLGRGNAPKGSRPQEKDEMSFLHNAKSNWKCT